MKKSKKTIIYMLVALFVAVSVGFVDAGNIYAKSYCEDVQDADWHYFTKADGQVSDAVIDISNYVSCDLPSDSKVSKYKYTEKLTFASTSWNDKNYLSDFVIGSDSEIIFCYENILSESSNEVLNLGAGSNVGYGSYFIVLSKTKFSVRSTDTQNLSEPSQSVSCSDESDSSIWNRDSFYMFSFSRDRYSPNIAFKSYKAKVFLDVSDALNYLSTGDTSGMAWQGSAPKQTYNKDVHFDKFNMDVHASNSLDNYYIDFRYSLPNSLVGKGYSLRIDSTYRREVSNVLTGDPYSSKEYTDFQYVTLSDNPFSCRVYLKNFNSVKLGLADKNKSTEPFYNYYGVLSYYDSVYLGLTSMADAAKVGYKVSMSLLNITCKLYRSGECGFAYSGSLDLLTGANDISSYTPDSNGTYKPNNDYRQNGYYYTEVSSDAAENTTYNYYYITNDNSRTEITKDENDNNSKSGEGIGYNSSSSVSTSGNINNNNSPTFNNNNHITIEGDSINNEVNNIVDSSTSAEDNKSFIEKFLGFFQLLENNSFLGVWGKVFGWLPPGISSVITTALGISAGIGIFRFFRR